MTSGQTLATHITSSWIQNFMQKNDIVCRSQCGKLQVSPAKRELIAREVAYHLGGLCRGFRKGTIKEDDVMNADETHFVINLHNHKTLARKGDSDVKYADVVNGDEGMAILVLLTGEPNYMILPPLMIFKNESSSHPIRGVPDDIPDVSYRSDLKAWVDRRIFGEWLNENRAVPNDQHDRKRILSVDNCSGHEMTDVVKQALTKENIELRFSPPNTTDVVQPADLHVIQKVKAAWRRRWNEKIMDIIDKKCRVNPSTDSGRLVNPGKSYFLRMAANAVRDVNSVRHKYGVLYSLRAMILCGLLLNLNGQWEERQLFKDLQAIISKYRENFNGLPVSHDQDLEREATESDDDQ